MRLSDGKKPPQGVAQPRFGARQLPHRLRFTGFGCCLGACGVSGIAAERK